MLAAILRRRALGRLYSTGNVLSPLNNPGEENNILHIRGIPKHATPEDILASPAFKNLKGIVSARKAFRNHLSSDFLLVEFESLAAAKAALTEHHTNPLSLDGEPLSIQYSRPHVKHVRPPSRPTDTLFIGTIPFIPSEPNSITALNDITALDSLLRAWTTSYGPIRRLAFRPAAAPTKPGYAHVQFFNFVDSRRLYESTKMHGATLEFLPGPSDADQLITDRSRFYRNKLILHLPSCPRSEHRLYVDYQGTAKRERDRDLVPNRRLVFRSWHDSLEALTSALPRDGSVMYVKFLKMPGTGYIVMRSTEDAKRLVEGRWGADVDVEYSRNVLPDGKGVGREKEEWEPVELPVQRLRERAKMAADGRGEKPIDMALENLMTPLGSWRRRD